MAAFAFEREASCAVDARASNETLSISIASPSIKADNMTSTNLADVSPPFLPDVTSRNGQEVSKNSPLFDLPSPVIREVSESSHVDAMHQEDIDDASNSLFGRPSELYKSLDVLDSTHALPTTLFDRESQFGPFANKSTDKGDLVQMSLLAALPDAADVQQPGFLLADYLRPASELSDGWETNSNDEVDRPSLAISVAIGATHNPFDDLSLPGGQFAGEELVDSNFKAAGDVTAMFDSDDAEMDQKNLVEVLSGLPVAAVSVSSEAVSGTSTETSRSAYFAARSSQLGTIETETFVNGEQRPCFTDSHSIHSPQSNEPTALYHLSFLQSEESKTDVSSTNIVAETQLSENPDPKLVELPDLGHDSLTIPPVESVLPDDFTAIRTGDDYSHLLSAHVDGLAGLSASYNKMAIDIPDLTFKTIGSPQFDSYHRLPLSQLENEAPGDDGAIVKTNHTVDWKGLTEDPRKLGAALGAVFAKEMSPSSVVPVSTESKASGRVNGEVSTHDSLTLTQTSMPLIGDLSGTDYKNPVSASTVGQGKTVDVDYEHQVTPLIARLPANNYSFQTSNYVASQGLHSQPVTENEFSLVSLNPDYICFREVCCVGCTLTEKLSVYSHCDKWLQLCIDTLNADRTEQKESCHGVFSATNRITIGPHTQEDIKVSFTPLLEGSYQATVRIVPSPLVPSSFSDFRATSLRVAVEAEAELPNVKLESDLIDFGQVACGGSKLLPVKLLNRGRSAVPLWLMITSHYTAWHSFSFVPPDGHTSSADVCRSNRPIELSHCPSIPLVVDQFPATSHSLATCIVQSSLAEEEFVTWLRFTAPLDSGSSTNTFSGIVDMRLNAVDLGSSVAKLALKATIGVARLEVSLKAVSLCCEMGKVVSRSIAVSNVGNMVAGIDMELSSSLSALFIHPSTLHILPGESRQVEVTFSPTSEETVAERVLHLTLAEVGETYDVLIRGTGTNEKKSFPLACNMPFLHFGGVEIGSTKQLELVLQSLLEGQSLDLEIEVERHQANFQLQMKSRALAGLVSSLQVTVQPKATITIGMTFIPTRRRLTQSNLIIRIVPRQGFRYMVPLMGYGGVSQVVTTSTKKSRHGEAIHMGEIAVGEQRVSICKLHNIGCRSAYVKAVCLSDAHVITVTPSEFILHPNELKELLVICMVKEISPITTDSPMTSTLGSLYVYHVDEYSRVRLKRALEQSGSDSHFLNLPKGLGSIVDFPDDETVAVEVINPTKLLEVEEQVFKSQLRDVCVTLTGSTKTELSYFGQDTMLKYRKIPEPNVQGTAKCQSLDSHPSWYVTPQEIIVPARSKTVTPRVTRVHLFNRSDRQLRFSVFWPKQLLTISPEKGVMDARHHVTILVSHRIGSVKQQLPWLGSMTVYCDGTYEAIRVQVRKGLVVDSPVLVPGTALRFLDNQQCLAQQSPGQGRVSMGKPERDSAVGKKPEMKAGAVKHVRRVVVEDTEIMQEKVTTLDVDLEVAETVEWRLWSVAPVYVKVDGSDQLMRATYAIFHFSHISGTCRGGEMLKLSVSFRPRDVGVYSQTWELEFGNMTSPWKDKARLWLTLSGVGLPLSSTRREVDNARSIVKGGGASHPVEENARFCSSPLGILYTKTSCVEFPVVPVGQSYEMKLKVGNRSRTDKLTVVATSSPPFKSVPERFVVLCRRYVYLGLFFTPDSSKGEYNGCLTLTAEGLQPETLQVQLQAKEHIT